MEKPYYVIENNKLQLKNVPVPMSHPVLGKIELSSIFRVSKFMNLILTMLWSNNKHALNVVQKMGLISVEKKTEKETNEYCNFVTVMIIKQMQSFCLQNGCSLLVMKFGRLSVQEERPDFVGTYAQIEADFLRLYGLQLGEVDYLDIDAEFEKREMPAEEVLKRGSKGHWNETGHRVVGEAVSDFLLKKLK